MDKYIHPDARNKEVEKRMKEIKDKWLVEDSIKQFKEIICDIQKTKEKKRH